MIQIHVWTSDGTYVGEVHSSSMMRFEVFADDESHRERIKKTLTDLAANGDFIEVRASDWRRSAEFPGIEWLGIASLLLLPKEGYRVHIIVDGRAELPA